MVLRGWWFSFSKGTYLIPRCSIRTSTHTMAVLSSAANGGSAQKVASLKWSEETIEVETCGRSYWSFLQRTRAIDNKQLGNVSAFAVDVEVDEEVGGSMVERRRRT